MSGWGSGKKEPSVGERLAAERDRRPGEVVQSFPQDDLPPEIADKIVPRVETDFEQMLANIGKRPEPDPDTYLGKLGYEPIDSKPRKISPRTRLS